MVNPGEILATNILKRSFQLVLTVINSYGEEHEMVFKKKRKQFINEIDFNTMRTKIIDGYPQGEMEPNVLYIQRTGDIVWAKFYEADTKLAD